MFNKKAQVGETMTWIIATIIIVVILAISIFIVSSFSFGLGKEFKFDRETDLFVTKSFVGYLMTNDGENKIYDKLKNKNNFDENSISKVDKDLSKKILYELYKKDYPDYRWMGIIHEESYKTITDYLFFGTMKERDGRNQDTFHTHKDTYISQEILLGKDKKIEFIGIKRLSLK